MKKYKILIFLKKFIKIKYKITRILNTNWKESAAKIMI